MLWGRAMGGAVGQLCGMWGCAVGMFNEGFYGAALMGPFCGAALWGCAVAMVGQLWGGMWGGRRNEIGRQRDVGRDVGQHAGLCGAGCGVG